MNDVGTHHLFVVEWYPEYDGNLICKRIPTDVDIPGIETAFQLSICPNSGGTKSRKYLSINTQFHQLEFSTKRSATTASASIFEIEEEILPEPAPGSQQSEYIWVMLLEQEWIILPRHVFHEANGMADNKEGTRAPANAISKNIINHAQDPMKNSNSNKESEEDRDESDEESEEEPSKKNRRNRIRKKQPSWSLHKLDSRAKDYVMEFLNANHQSSQVATRRVQVKWSPPSESGQIIAALSRKIPLVQSVELANAMAARRALVFAKELSLFDVEIEGGCARVLAALNMSRRCNTLFGHVFIPED
ncbi:hypothetical protein CFP56_031078 [Quercus suber]|uniref:RNase H type-1 domain-containing protein n=1 Tax=Quercus suber TaxID=58331 RepID=A0AAW0LTI2_QUESU